MSKEHKRELELQQELAALEAERERAKEQLRQQEEERLRQQEEVEQQRREVCENVFVMRTT